MHSSQPNGDRDLLADVRVGPPSPWARWGRRAGLGLLLILVLLGASGQFGVRRGTAHASDAGYRLTVDYPRIARAGLDVPLRIKVEHNGGFNSEPTIAMTSSYFDMFEAQGTYPEPDTATNDGTLVYYQFSQPPPDQPFVLDYDLYVQPGSQLGKRATVAVIIGGRQVVSLDIHTWLVP